MFDDPLLFIKTNKVFCFDVQKLGKKVFYLKFIVIVYFQKILNRAKKYSQVFFFNNIAKSINFHLQIISRFW